MAIRGLASFNQGRDVPNVNCPKCGSGIRYNGNYFCRWWSEGCDWALPHPQTEFADKMTSFKLQGFWEGEEIIVDDEPRWVIHSTEPKED